MTRRREYDEKQRRQALKGEKTPFIQDEVLTEIGADLEQFRMVYRFFSQPTHSGPLTFYRMVDHDRGTGVETRHEKRYMIMVIGFAAQFLAEAIDVLLDIVPDAETRTPHLTDQQVRKNFEEAQGRSRARK